MYSSVHMSPRATPIQSPMPTCAKPTAWRTLAKRNTAPRHQMLMLKYGVFSTMMYLRFSRWRPSIFSTTAAMFKKRKPVR
jgi:hypothetical protein